MKSPVMGLAPGDSLEKALEMFDHHMISGAPVLESDGKVVGVLSRTDIGAHLARGGEIIISAESVMTPYVFLTRPEEPITKVLTTMTEMRIHRVVVTDKEDRAVGIVTTMDLLAEMLQILAV